MYCLTFNFFMILFSTLCNKYILVLVFQTQFYSCIFWQLLACLQFWGHLQFIEYTGITSIVCPASRQSISSRTPKRSNQSLVLEPLNKVLHPFRCCFLSSEISMDLCIESRSVYPCTLMMWELVLFLFHKLSMTFYSLSNTNF